MKGWLLALIGIGILDCWIKIDGKGKFNLGCVYRLIVFIICCIWG